MKNYIIPYGTRSTNIDLIGSKQTLMVVDNIGIIVRHSAETIPIAELVRKHLIGTSDQYKMLVQNQTFEGALAEFFDIPECKCGGKYKAMYIVDSEQNPVIEFESCRFLQPHPESGNLYCQRYADQTESGFDNLMCVINYVDDPPEDCVMNNQKQQIGWKASVIRQGGIWLKVYNKI